MKKFTTRKNINMIRIEDETLLQSIIITQPDCKISQTFMEYLGAENIHENPLYPSLIFLADKINNLQSWISSALHITES